MAAPSIFDLNMVVLDFETTGLDPNRHEVVEIGAVMLRPDFSFKKALTLRVKPDHIETAEPKALQVNGYTEEKWKNGATQAEGLYRLLNFVQDSVVFSYNIRFDWSFIEFWVRRHDQFGQSRLPRYALDVMTLGWFYQLSHGKSYITLKNSCKSLGIREERAVHHAINGALAGARVLRKLCCEQKLERSDGF